MKIGEIIPADREIVLNEGKKTTKILVANKGDRPVQVGSHFHFFEVNKCLSFDREAAYGYHLDIPSGTSVRFEPGEEKEVQLTEMGGRKRVFGLNDLTRARAAEDTKKASMEKAALKGFLSEPMPGFSQAWMKFRNRHIPWESRALWLQKKSSLWLPGFPRQKHCTILCMDRSHPMFRLLFCSFTRISLWWQMRKR